MRIAVKTAAGIAVASALLVGSPLVAQAEDVRTEAFDAYSALEKFNAVCTP